MIDRPLIFLDIDGVLNSADDETEALWSSGGGFFCRENVEAFNQMVERSTMNPGIVVSSVWRLDKSDEEMSDVLKEIGVNADYVGMTENHKCIGKSVFRGNEIHHWLRQNCRFDYDNYLIIDDDTDMLLWQKDNFVKIDGKKGFTSSDIADCIRILMFKGI